MERLACSRVADGEGLGKPDAAEKVLKAWIIAQGIKVGMHFKELQNIGLFLIEIADARVFGGIGLPACSGTRSEEMSLITYRGTRCAHSATTKATTKTSHTRRAHRQR